MPKTTTELILENSRLAIAGYPTQGVTLKDSIEITLELCADDERHPTPKTVKSLIKRADFYKQGVKFYPGKPPIAVLPVATVANSSATPSNGEIPVLPKSTRNRADWRLRVYGGVRGQE